MSGDVTAYRGGRGSRFGSDVQKLTEERGSVYGPPKVDFDRAARLKAVIAECPDPLARHALEMIAVKIARLINSPDHKDSWVDIAGYSKCGIEVACGIVEQDEPPK